MEAPIDDAYAMLELPPDATADQIKRAYRRLARQWHPDRNASPEAAERFKEVARAYEALSDPTKRRRHDAHRASNGSQGIPDSFVNAVANAVERAQDWIEGVVLPHYASQVRGKGLEAASRLVADIPMLCEPQKFKGTSTILGRRRARKFVGRVSVRFVHDWDATTLRVGKDHTAIGVSPAGLWRGGFRDDDPIAVDDAVLQLLLLRYAQAFGAGRIHLPVSEGAAAWAEALAQARLLDTQQARWDMLWNIIWASISALILFMWYAGATSNR